MFEKLKLLVVAAFLAVVALASGCAYGGAAAIDQDTVVITKTSFFGITTAVYVCQVTDEGLTACSKRQSP